MDYCAECYKPCETTEIDEGIGSYEYGSIQGRDVCWVKVSRCCEAPIENEQPRVFMNPHTGHVDTLDSWYPQTLEDSCLIPVEWNEIEEQWEEIEDEVSML